MSEIEEVDLLLQSATYNGIIKVLNDYKLELLSKQATKNTSSSAAASSANIVPPSPPPTVPTVSTKILPNHSSGLNFIPIQDFSWDQGSYGSSNISIYVELKDVGTVKDNISFTSTSDSFDLTITGLNGKNYRLFKDNLENDIVPEESKFVVKTNKVIIKLTKKKGQYSYENWQNLVSKKSKEEKNKRKQDPSGSIMDMMKDLYNDGDDNMKKIIGEAMMKSQRGEKDNNPPNLDN